MSTQKGALNSCFVAGEDRVRPKEAERQDDKENRRDSVSQPAQPMAIRHGVRRVE